MTSLDAPHLERRIRESIAGHTPDARVIDGYWTVPCGDGCKRGRWRIGTWRIWLYRAPTIRKWIAGLPTAYRSRKCVACKGTGRTIVCEARHD